MEHILSALNDIVGVSVVTKDTDDLRVSGPAPVVPVASTALLATVLLFCVTGVTVLVTGVQTNELSAESNYLLACRTPVRARGV